MKTLADDDLEPSNPQSVETAPSSSTTAVATEPAPTASGLGAGNPAYSVIIPGPLGLTGPSIPARRPLTFKRVAKWIAVTLFVLSLAPAGWLANRLWPRKLPVVPDPPALRVFLHNGQIGIALPTPVLVANVGRFSQPLPAYLRYVFLQSQKDVNPSHVFLCSSPTWTDDNPQIFLQVDNDLLQSIPYLGSLVSEGSISDFSLKNWTYENLSACAQQSSRIAAAFGAPPSLHLYQVPDKQLIGPMADFLVFKSETDRRVLGRGASAPAALTTGQARDLAQNILVISRFYSLPLEYFLAVGAMENNYMSVRGDLGHAVWVRHLHPGDVVVKRRRGRFLVRNYSLGVWQITRETLRYAELLYLRDRQSRDYSILPADLVPEIVPDPDNIRPAVLTTYAGLLLRNLLDHFHGNIMKAIGAYNGGSERPNLAYADSVRVIARYARRVIYHAVTIAAAEKQTPADFFPPPRHGAKLTRLQIPRSISVSPLSSSSLTD